MKRMRLRAEHVKRLHSLGLDAGNEDGCFALRLEPGENITGPEPISCLYVVVEGRAAVLQHSPDGKTLIISEYVSEGVLGEIELLIGNSNREMRAVAITGFECIAVPFKVCREALETSLLFNRTLAGMLAEKLAASTRTYAATVFCTAEERLCAHILRNADGGVFRGLFTEVADMTGMSYRHMFRILERLSEEGLLEHSRGGVRVLDLEGLVRRAGPALSEREIARLSKR